VVARSAERLIALLVVLRASLLLLLTIAALIHAVAVVPAPAISAYGIRS
jgi:hypothetical protein